MARFPFPQRAVLVCLLLAALLVAPAAADGEPRPQSRAGLAARVLELPVQLWNLFTGFWEKEGCGIDSHGLCVLAGTGNDSSETDAGCGIDPHGGCASGH